MKIRKKKTSRNEENLILQLNNPSSLGFQFFTMGFKFEKLLVWQKAIDLSEIVNEVTKQFPKEEVFVLSSQMKRAADSVSLNIAEGSTGQTNPEFKRFLSIAIRSNIEVVCCIYLAKKRGIIKSVDFDKIYQMCEELLVMMNALKLKLY